MRRRWAHVKKMSDGTWDYVIYVRPDPVTLHCSGSVGFWLTWREAFNAAHAHAAAIGAGSR